MSRLLSLSIVCKLHGAIEQAQAGINDIGRRARRAEKLPERDDAMSGFFWSLLFCRCVHHSADVLPRSPLSFNMEGAGRGAGVRAGCMRRLAKIAIGAQHEVVSLADGQPHCPFPLLARQQYGQTWPLAHLTGVQVCRCAGVEVCTHHARQTKSTHSNWGVLSTWPQHLTVTRPAAKDGFMAPTLLKYRDPRSSESGLAPHNSRTRPNGCRPKIHTFYLQV
jgi:hypothetical protein